MPTTAYMLGWSIATLIVHHTLILTETTLQPSTSKQMQLVSFEHRIYALSTGIL